MGSRKINNSSPNKIFFILVKIPIHIRKQSKKIDSFNEGFVKYVYDIIIIPQISGNNHLAKRILATLSMATLSWQCKKINMYKLIQITIFQ